MKIGIICAMESEYSRLAERLHQKTESGDNGFRYQEGTMGANTLVLTQCGIGKVNAAVGTAELIRRFAPHCIISTGVAGGIDAVLRVADVVVSDSVVYHDVWCGEGNAYGQVQGLPARYEGDRTLLQQALRLDAICQPHRIHAGLICTGDRFITSRDELSAIKAHFPDGLAVDMESAAIAQTCHLYGTPFISFRVISDTPGAVDDHAAQYADFWGAMADRSFRTIWAFLSAIDNCN